MQFLPPVLISPLVLSLALIVPSACKGGEKDEKAGKVAPTPSKVEPEAPTPVTQTHANGMDRFKDPGVYLDGKPLGVLRFGEIPVPLEPVWFEEKGAVPFKAGDKGPRYKIVKQRRYRFRDYFAAMGVDVSKIKEMHMYGGNNRAAAVVIPGSSIREMDDFLFRFGGSIWGKPLPACPAGVGDGKCPDQIGSLAVYVEKEPPKREGGHFYFEGKLITGIPYFGEPIRGGVRIYLDGPLAATIKRNKLRAGKIEPVSSKDGQDTYKLFDYLTSQGVDTNVVQEAWLIQYERRVEKLNREELLSATFVAGQGGSGEVLVGDKLTPTHAIALHTKPISPEDMPQLTKEEIEKADG